MAYIDVSSMYAGMGIPMQAEKSTGTSTVAKNKSSGTNAHSSTKSTSLTSHAVKTVAIDGNGNPVFGNASAGGASGASTGKSGSVSLASVKNPNNSYLVSTSDLPKTVGYGSGVDKGPQWRLGATNPALPTLKSYGFDDTPGGAFLKAPGVINPPSTSTKKEPIKITIGGDDTDVKAAALLTRKSTNLAVGTKDTILKPPAKLDSASALLAWMFGTSQNSDAMGYSRANPGSSVLFGDTSMNFANLGNAPARSVSQRPITYSDTPVESGHFAEGSPNASFEKQFGRNSVTDSMAKSSRWNTGY